MIIQLRDQTEITVNAERAEKVKRAIESDVKGIEIDGEWFRADYVVRIKPGGVAQQNYNNKQIEEPDHRGQNSANKEKIRAMLKEKGIGNGSR